MEPKTKLHKSITGLSAQLPVISDVQKQWAFDKCLKKYGIRSRNTLFCLECGHAWKNESNLITALEGCVCPGCDNTLKLKQGGGPQFQEMEYCGIITTLGSYQVVRILCLHKSMKKNQGAAYFGDEVMQHWIDESGKVVTLEKQVRGFSYQVDLWLYSTALEVRTKSARSEIRHAINPWAIFPAKKVLPIVKRNGFKSSVCGISPIKFFVLLLKDAFFETLIKAGQYSLLKYYPGHKSKVRDYWYAVKICMRNGYRVKDASIWFDYLDLLEYFGKDLRNAKFICPADLKKAHDTLMYKKRGETPADAEEAFVKRRKKFFKLKFQEGKIKVLVIKSVEDFKKEGDILKHCLFKNEYHKKSDSLILSARIEDKPIETVEVSLRDFEVSQSRGKNNVATKYNADIINLVNKNMHAIRAIAN